MWYYKPDDMMATWRKLSQGHLGVNIGTECLTDLDYADDVALLAASCGNVVDSLEKMGQEASKFCLEINWSKTKIQPVGVQGPTMSWWQATRWRLSAVSATMTPMLRQMEAAVRRYVGGWPLHETA